MGYKHKTLRGIFPKHDHFDHPYSRITKNLTVYIMQQGNWARVSLNITGPDPCILSVSDDCLNSKKGSDYRGTKSTTPSGRTCQNWNTQKPHSHSRTPQRYDRHCMVDKKATLFSPNTPTTFNLLQCSPQDAYFNRSRFTC